MTILFTQDGSPYFAFDCYTWCHPQELDFGDCPILDYLVHKGKHHFVPLYVQCMCGLARGLRMCPAYVPGASLSNVSVLLDYPDVAQATAFYEEHLAEFLHTPDTFPASGQPQTIQRDLLPLRGHLLEIIYVTNWRNTLFAAPSRALLLQDLPVIKKHLVPFLEGIDHTLFKGLCPELEWRVVSLDELRSSWGYPSPAKAWRAFET